MEAYTFVISIICIVVGGNILNTYLKSRERFAARNQDDGVASKELEELRHRVEVLEKIITDDRYQLDKEIANLERRA